MAKGDFMTIEVEFLHGNELKRFVKRNNKWEEVEKFRLLVFDGGLMIPAYTVDPEGGWSVGTWFVVSPWNLKAITITRQTGYFKE